MLLLGRAGEFYTFGVQVGVGLFDVIDLPRRVDEGSDAVFVTVGREEHDTRFGARDGQLNPALLFGELLICQNAKAKLFRVEAECTVLVTDRDAEEFDALDHTVYDASPVGRNQWAGCEQPQRML